MSFPAPIDYRSVPGVLSSLRYECDYGYAQFLMPGVHRSLCLLGASRKKAGPHATLLFSLRCDYDCGRSGESSHYGFR